MMLHDSACKDIDLKKLMKGNYENSEKVFMPTIKDAVSYLDKINHAKLIILHLGINDLKLKPVDVVSSDLEDLTKMGLEKARKVLLSLPLMCKNQELSYNVAGLVNMLLFFSIQFHRATDSDQK